MAILPLRKSSNVSKESETTKDYNEFLILYARDLISSIPSERTVAVNVDTRMTAAASALPHHGVTRQDVRKFPNN